MWETRLPTSVQGFPVAYAAGGVEYVAVPTGLRGGSPRFVPRVLALDLRHPRTGNGLFVFRLPARQ